jgi:methionyl-tRNA formyltransferase
MDNLFTCKSNKPFAKEAAKLFSHEVGGVEILTESDAAPISEHGYGWFDLDYIVSYIGPFVFKDYVLQKAKKAAINFHPGPPEYPGIGCTNFAIYDGVEDFGITVHHMEPKVDSGEIIMVKRFPIAESDSVWTLSQKCYAYIFAAFCELLPLFKAGDNMRKLSVERWKREPYTRKQLNELCIITEDMSDEEVRRRVRATSFPNMPGAYIEKGGYKFEYVS